MKKFLKYSAIALCVALLITAIVAVIAVNDKAEAGASVKTGAWKTGAVGKTFVFNGEECNVTDGKITTEAGVTYTLITAYSDFLKMSGATSGNFIVTDNITLAAQAGSAHTTNFGNATGITLEGCGYELTFPSGSSQPLFEMLTGTVNNLVLSGSVSMGTSSAGMVATSISGTFTKVIVKDGSSVIGTHAGGFAASTAAATTFIECENHADVTGHVINSKSNGIYVGGFVGYSNYSVTFTDCANYGDISAYAYTIDNAVDFTSTTTGTQAAGGFVGRVQNTSTLTITSGYNEGAITGNKMAGGLVAWVNRNSSNGTYYNPSLYIDSVSDDTENETKTVNKGSVSCIGKVSGTFAGGIVGQSGALTAIIRNAENYGTVSCVNNNAAGIIGQSYILNISDCKNFASGSVSGTSNVGGIVGYSGDTLTMDDCDNFAAVNGKANNSTTGGIIGKHHGAATISNCDNNGKITSDCKNNAADCVGTGGIVGGVRTGSSNATSGQAISFVIRNCTNNGEIDGTTSCTYIGGILGVYGKIPPAVTIDGCTNNGDVILSSTAQRYGAAGGITAGPALFDLYFGTADMGAKVTIKNSVNNGDIISKAKGYEAGSNATYAPSDLGGILARTGHSGSIDVDGTTVNTTTKITIENCANTGDIIDSYPGRCSAAGIVGRSQIDDATNSSLVIDTCYSTGYFNVTNSAGTYGIVREQTEANIANITVTNCYYANAKNNDFSNAGKITPADASNGRLAYLLNSGDDESVDVWYQNIDNGQAVDKSPVKDSTHGKVYLGTNITYKGVELGYKCTNTYTATPDIQEISFETNGVGLRLGDTSARSGLRWTSVGDAADLALLASAFGDDVITGTLIVPEQFYQSNISNFTMEYLDSLAADKGLPSGSFYVNVKGSPANLWATGTVAGSVVNYKSGTNFNTRYYGIAYIQVGDTIVYSTEVRSAIFKELLDEYCETNEKTDAIKQIYALESVLNVTNKQFNMIVTACESANTSIATVSLLPNGNGVRILPKGNGTVRITVYDWWENPAYVDVTVTDLAITSSTVTPIAGTSNGTVKNVILEGATVNDGVSDVAYINNAISAVSKAGGGTVYLPAGIYNARGIILKDNVTLRLQGRPEDVKAGYDGVKAQVDAGKFAVIENDKVGDWVLANFAFSSTKATDGADNVAIIGGMFDFCGTPSPSTRPQVSNAAVNGSTSTGGLVFSCASNITIEGVIFKDAYNSHAFQIAGVSDMTIKDCMFAGYTSYYNSTASSHSIHTRETIQIEYTHSGAFGAPSSNPYRDFADGEYYYCSNIAVTGCYFGDSDEAAYHMACIGQHGANGKANATGLTITDNVFDNPYCSALRGLNYVDVKITGNKFISSQQTVRKNSSLTSIFTTDSYFIDLYVATYSTSTDSGVRVADVNNHDGLRDIYIKDNEFIISGNSDMRCVSIRGRSCTYGYTMVSNKTMWNIEKLSSESYTGFLQNTNTAVNVRVTGNTFNIATSATGTGHTIYLYYVYGYTVSSNTWQGKFTSKALSTSNCSTNYILTISKSQSDKDVWLRNPNGITTQAKISTSNSTTRTIKLNGAEGIRFVVTIGSGGELRIKVVADEGYTFKGWYTNSAGTTKVTSTTITSDVTYYAIVEKAS